MDPDLKPLHDALAQTMAPDPGVIKQAEAFLQSAKLQPRYGISILKLVSLDSVQLAVRQQGAVQFKNYIKYQWAPRERDDGIQLPSIPDPDKEQIKSHITELMLSAPSLVRAQLSEALTIMSSHDFPKQWPNLLPQLIQKMETDNDTILNGVLATADSIFQRYRGQYLTDELNEELMLAQSFVRPLLAVMQRLTGQCVAPTTSGGIDALPALLTNVRLTLSVFYSLNSPGLTEEFEETLQAWMDCIHAVLTFGIPSGAPTAFLSTPDKEGPLDAVKAMACECLSLFMERNEEEFSPFLERFATAVWQQLVSVGPGVGQDNLAMAAIAFLTTVARSVHYGLFADVGVLTQVCEGIVIPNLRLRDDDMELFEMNWVDYVRRDTEGSDSDTRRRAASEMVRVLVEKFPEQTTELFSKYVGSLLAEAAAAPDAAWVSKDAAIYLVSALAARSRTAAGGATATNELVNLQEFYTTHVGPELAAANVNARPIIKADCLKFAATFRSQLPHDLSLDLFPRAAALLGSKSNVVHSYAAILVDRLLAMKVGGAPAFSSTELAPYLQPLLERLFGALQLPESEENEYVMRAVMRVIAFVGTAIAPIATLALRQLSDILLAVARNPKQPGFNHYLFESIAALVKFGCTSAPDSIGGAEGVLFPPFQIVLQEDVQEFHPYVFQLLAQLVELRGRGLPETYLALLPPLLSPVFWERSGNVPALGRLLRAYVAAAPQEIVSRGLLTGVLGVFQKLVASKANDHEGMALLDQLTVNIDPDNLAQYMPTVWGILFHKLQTARTPKIARCFLYSVALLAAKKGGAAAAQSMDAVQAGVTSMIVQGVLAPVVAGPGSPLEDKVVLVGVGRLLCEAPDLQTAGSDAAAGALLTSLVQRLAGRKGEDRSEEETDFGVEVEGLGGYTAAYAKLHNAAAAEVDPLADVSDPRGETIRGVSAWSAQTPGRIARLLAGAPDAATALLSLGTSVGVTIM